MATLNQYTPSVGAENWNLSASGATDPTRCHVLLSAVETYSSSRWMSFTRAGSLVTGMPNTRSGTYESTSGDCTPAPAGAAVRSRQASNTGPVVIADSSPNGRIGGI